VVLPTSPAPAPSTSGSRGAVSFSASWTVGADAQPFTVAANQVLIVPFPNLPSRSTFAGTLQAQGSTLSLTNRDTLHFLVTLQSVVGATPQVGPRVRTTGNVIITSAILPGSTPYRGFAGIITGSPLGGASGVISGTITVIRS
jgi:hypothetical protein